MTAVIEMDTVGKRYWQLHEQPTLLKSLMPGYRSRRSERWALRNINLQIEEAETVGIVGHNGAGKTTLLRLLAGVSRPSEGRVRIRGRVAPLIGVGVGFHLEMSGRENVLVNGMLLGLSRREIEGRFEQIVEFSEMSDFIDTPVKFYSSGMYLRLGFAVAVHVRPDVLLVDEVLAVGDLGFQRKCFDRMRDLQAEGTTIVIVSHSMAAIRLLCPRAILVRHGAIEIDGPAENVIARHHELMSRGESPGAADAAAPAAPVDVLTRQLVDQAGPTYHPEAGSSVTYTARLRFNAPVDSPQFFFRVTSEQGVICYQTETEINRRWDHVEAGQEVDVKVTFEARLSGGTYGLGFIVSDRRAKQVLLSDPDGLFMFIATRVGTIGIADLAARISVDGRDLSDHNDLLIAARSEPPKEQG